MTWLNFRDSASTICYCRSEREPIEHFEKEIFDSLHDIDPSVLKFQEDLLTNILSFGCDKCEETVNKKTLQSTDTYRKSTNHLKWSQINQWHPLLWMMKKLFFCYYTNKYMICFSPFSLLLYSLSTCMYIWVIQIFSIGFHLFPVPNYNLFTNSIFSIWKPVEELRITNVQHFNLSGYG